jgi:hypothetical protein
MSEVMMPPAPAGVVERKCEIEQVFDPSFIQLLRLAPRNPIVRALILKQTGKMPSPELETFAEIKEWVETNCDRNSLPAHSRPMAAADGISINVEFSEIEYGRASYSVSRAGRDSFQVEADELLEIIQRAIEAGEALEHVVEVISDKVEEDAWNQCEPDLDDYGDYDYTDHDSNDSDESKTTCSKTEIRDAVLAFLRARHPELVPQL